MDDEVSGSVRSWCGGVSGFVVRLARSGRDVTVAPGCSILDALLEAGLDVPYACRQGVCGTCEVGVVEGVPDHRDFVLGAEEQEAGRSMMICVSGARSACLILDI